MVKGIDSPRRHGDTEEFLEVRYVDRMWSRIFSRILEITEAAEGTESCMILIVPGFAKTFLPRMDTDAHR